MGQNAIAKSERHLPAKSNGIKSGFAQAANKFAQKQAFPNYMDGKSQNTIKAQSGDLAVFGKFLCDSGTFYLKEWLSDNPNVNNDEIEKEIADFEQWLTHICPKDESPIELHPLQKEKDLWADVSYGLVECFKKWMMDNGYSIGSVNRRLSTVKTYAKLAAKAGVIDASEHAMIRMVSGYSQKEGENVNEKRSAENADTRMTVIVETKDDNGDTVQTKKARKKAESVNLSTIVDKLKNNPDTPQGRRDNVLMTLLLDHGLRASELAALTVDAFNLKEGTFRFRRPKVKGTDKEHAQHKLTSDALRAVTAWLATDAPAIGTLLRGSRKGGHLTDVGMSTVSISDRVRTLAKSHGVENASAHDCRHYCATVMAKGHQVNELCNWFGWRSPAMALRYIDNAEVAERRD